MNLFPQSAKPDRPAQALICIKFILNPKNEEFIIFLERLVLHRRIALQNGMDKAIPAIEELVENFALFSDWEERYRYLIDLGRMLPHMDECLKIDDHIVRGCTSRVWMVADTKDGILRFQADSDAHIVRGLVVLLYSAYQQKSSKEIAGIDIETIFKDIGLDQNLSPNRRNGFYAMVQKIRALSQP